MNAINKAQRHGAGIRVLAASIGALIATGGLTSVAVGQESEESNSSGADTIVVTGTRIRRDDFSAANATTVITGDEMQNLGVVSVADMVNQLPNNIASVSPEATADSPFFLGASIANMRGLNTAFGVRTLTLLDSRRVTPTNNGGGVDMNFIPSALVGRVETITGGASATYGADAMAGVVNVILDDNIDNIRVDLNYLTSDDPGGDQYTLSFGTGAQFFDGRGRLTVGLDSSRQDAIEDCTTREFCQRGLGLLRNGTPLWFFETILDQRYGVRTPPSVIDPTLPQWIQTEGHRYTVTPNGVIAPPGLDGFFDVYNDGTVADPDGDLTLGWYQFTEDGTNVEPYLHDLQDDGNFTAEQQLAFINSVGTQTGFYHLIQGGGSWATPYGGGRNIYADVPIRPETNRDNLFTRFTYELEGGIEVSADLTYGQTDSESLQNSSRNNLQSFCVLGTNAYLQGPAEDGSAGQLLQDVFAARAQASTGTPGDVFNSVDCFQAPYTAASFNERPPGSPQFDYPGGLEIHKDFSTQVDRRNTNKSESMSLTLAANGSLFEGGSWTWDGYLQFGHTENRQRLTGWRAARRWDMAIDSVIDTDGEIRCSILSDVRGDEVRQQWENYLFIGVGEDTTEQERTDLINAFAEGCEPVKPFGSEPLTAAQRAYAFPTLYEGTDNDQTAMSISFSGDAWRGIGDAGAMQLASGIDWRQNDTQNIADPNRFLGADFNFVGNSSTGAFQRIYGDNWRGETTTEEAWVEVDLPLLRNKPAVQYLSVNTSFRRTENETQRISGIELSSDDAFQRDQRAVDSWKATMQWRPVDLMNIRMTRSADTRAPSASELFRTNSYAAEAGGYREIITPFRFDDPNGAPGLTEDYDEYILIEGGNPKLDPERSITETLGFVFSPSESIPGLQISVDYYQTTVKGGIQRVTAQQTLQLCAQELGDYNQDPFPQIALPDTTFCNNIEFAGVDDADQLILPDDQNKFFDSNGDALPGGSPNPYAGYGGLTNVISVAESAINTEDFVSRGIDYSISYATQFSGGGSISARALFTRFLEQRIVDQEVYGPHDVSGQTGGSNLLQDWGSFSVNYTPTPKIRGNLYMTYSKNAFSMTAQARYTGSGKLNNQQRWLGPGDSITYTDHDGGVPDPFGAVTVNYDPQLARTVLTNDLPSFTTLNLNFSYDFGLSRMQIDRFESLSAYLNIENVGDRIPNFFSGVGAGGINTALFSAMGRTYRMGVRMEF